MTIKELSEIIATGDNDKIKDELKKRGYTDCRADKGKLGNIPLSALFAGDMENTPTIGTHKATIITAVAGYDNCEIIVIIDGNKNVSVYGKEN